MDLSQTTMFSMLKRRLDHSATRQSVIADNIANANTPGFRAKDVKQPDFDSQFRRLTKMQPVQPNASHMKGTVQEARFRAEEERRPQEVLISGNAVQLEDEMLKMAETRGGYERAAALYRKQTNMVKLAIGKPQ